MLGSATGAPPRRGAPGGAGRGRQQRPAACRRFAGSSADAAAAIPAAAASPALPAPDAAASDGAVADAAAAATSPARVAGGPGRCRRSSSRCRGAAAAAGAGVRPAARGRCAAAAATAAAAARGYGHDAPGAACRPPEGPPPAPIRPPCRARSQLPHAASPGASTAPQRDATLPGGPAGRLFGAAAAFFESSGAASGVRRGMGAGRHAGMPSRCGLLLGCSRSLRAHACGKVRMWCLAVRQRVACCCRSAARHPPAPRTRRRTCGARPLAWHVLMTNCVLCALLFLAD